MKTNHSARSIVRIRRIANCLALIGMVGASFWLGGSLAARVGQIPASQTQEMQMPNVSLADLMASAR